MLVDNTGVDGKVMPDFLFAEAMAVSHRNELQPEIFVSWACLVVVVFFLLFRCIELAGRV